VALIKANPGVFRPAKPVYRPLAFLASTSSIAATIASAERRLASCSYAGGGRFGCSHRTCSGSSAIINAAFSNSGSVCRWSGVGSVGRSRMPISSTVVLAALRPLPPEAALSEPGALGAAERAREVSGRVNPTAAFQALPLGQRPARRPLRRRIPARPGAGIRTRGARAGGGRSVAFLAAWALQELTKRRSQLRVA
jgi:hypothetical protein